MKASTHKITRRLRRKRGIRKRIFGQPDRPRLTIFRSNKNIYAQIIDDLTGRTLASASTREKDAKVANGGNCSSATDVGKLIAERAVKAGISTVAFDRS